MVDEPLVGIYDLDPLVVACESGVAQIDLVWKFNVVEAVLFGVAFVEEAIVKVACLDQSN